MKKTYYFYNKRKGILNQLLDILLSKRKEVKNEMENHDKESITYLLLDKK